MRLEIHDEAKEDLRGFDKQLQLFFMRHNEKLIEMPPRKKHTKYGIPFHKKDVTKQARLIYAIENEVFIIIRCFATHKKYEKWYNSYKT
jgi:mRNA-degrading endonuclease RelE of RelBE toxin-antitoxin system